MEAAITQLEVNRRLAAILAADAGYSRLMGEDEEATLRALSSQRAILARCIDRHHGRVVSTAGDAVLADFASVVDAVACALTAQEELATAQADEAERRRLRFRIGVHLGDVLAAGGEVYGEGVNIASRLESIAEPGGICVSATVYDLIRNKLPVAVEPLGEQRFENIAEPISAYRVRQLDAVPPAPSGEQLRPDKSIAVLPFDNLSRDPEQNYFADGMTEEILTSLARLPELFVIARNSSFVYKNQPTDVREVSRQLGVKYILEGSVRRAGERVRISTQLVDGEAGVQMWAERYDGVLDDVFGLQDDVTQQIVSALELRLSREQRAGRLVETGTAQVQAYDYFLRGREQVLRYTQEANETARAMFEKAIEIDPSYAPAVVGLAETCYYESVHNWVIPTDSTPLDRAEQFAHRALQLDARLPAAHMILAAVLLWRKRFDEAIASYRHAIALDPNDADGYAGLAEALTCDAEGQAALAEIGHAKRLNPHFPPWYLTVEGEAYLSLERYEEAIAAFERSAIRNPDLVGNHLLLAACYDEIGEEAKARAAMARCLEFSPALNMRSVIEQAPIRQQAVVERLAAAFRRAGMPE